MTNQQRQKGNIIINVYIKLIKMCYFVCCLLVCKSLLRFSCEKSYLRYDVTIPGLNH